MRLGHNKFVNFGSQKNCTSYQVLD